MDTFGVQSNSPMTDNQESTTNSSEQDNEISSLRNYFKDKIRILSSIGQFSYILKIRQDEYDVSLTLQLDSSYPSKAPEIIITAPRLSPDQIVLIQQVLQSYSETLLKKPMILPIYLRLMKWFEENNIQMLTAHLNHDDNHQTNSVAPPNHRSRRNSKGNNPVLSMNNHSKTNHTDEPATEQAKRSSMKTAEDVISRIEWDTRLDKSLFRVGYVDRFLGIQEKSFSDFDFKVDLSTISDRHSTVLAIPKHRIRYFKYDNEIVWDKETRTDLMFGSTGNEQTIYDVVERHKKTLIENNDSPTLNDNDAVENVYTNISSPRYLTITDGAYKPNYYLSIPITDQSLLTNYTKYQENLLSSYPSLFSCHINASNLHVTLLTFYFETASQIEQCKTLLYSLRDEIHRHCSDPEDLYLEFNEINVFHDKILYIRCKQNQRLENLRTLIFERLSEEQQKQNTRDVIFAGNYYEFIPHITLLKCKRKCSSVCPNEIKEFYFGKQNIDSLQISPIGKNENDEQKPNCVFQLNLN